MSQNMRLFSALVVFAAIIPGTKALAQRDDAEWMANCNEQRRYDRYDRERYCEIRTTRMPVPGGTITVDGLRNGGVTVIGSGPDSLIVKTRLEVQARTMADARAIARDVRTVVRGSRIQAEGPRTDNDSWWSANLVIWTPQKSDLRLSAQNGPMTVEDVSGEMELETRNGPLALRNLAGNVRARTTNGPLSITLGGNAWTGAGLDAQTSNGPLSIRIPEGYSAHLEAGTSNGPMSLGFPVTVVGRIGRNISTDLGRGGTTIRAMTHNGPLSIERR
jgi:hypothetical protein